jgi:hypothetical protein
LITSLVKVCETVKGFATALATGATTTCRDKPARIWAKIIKRDVKILEVLTAFRA